MQNKGSSQEEEGLLDGGAQGATGLFSLLTQTTQTLVSNVVLKHQSHCCPSDPIAVAINTQKTTRLFFF